MPRSAGPPEVPDLRFMAQHARENVGAPVELTWTPPGSYNSYSLIATLAAEGGEPGWALTLDDGRKSRVVWQAEKAEYDLVRNVSHNVTQTVEGQIAAAAAAAPPPAVVSGTSHAAFTAASAQQYQTIPPAAQSDNRVNQSSTGGRAIGQAAIVIPESGNIEDKKILDLVEDLIAAKATGKVEIVSDEASGEIYVEEGQVEHATCGPKVNGDEALLQFMSLDSGSFVFTAGVKTAEFTVQEPLPEQLQRAQRLIEYRGFLNQTGLDDQYYVWHRRKDLTDADIEKDLVPFPIHAGLASQKKAYARLKNKRSISEFRRLMKLSPCDWIELMYSLVRSELVVIAPPADEELSTAFAEDAAGGVDAMTRELINPKTGMFGYSVLLRLLEHECRRFQTHQLPVSLVIFDIVHEEVGNLPPEVMAQVGSRIGLVKRRLDVVGHFEAKNFAIVLPNTRAGTAALVAARAMQALTTGPLAPRFDKTTLTFSVGIASLPDDGFDMGALTRAAKMAMNEAQQSDFAICLSRGIS